jgi:hypothetical protein
MVLLFSAIQFAVKRIASIRRQAGIADLGGPVASTGISAQRDAPKPLDLVAVRQRISMRRTAPRLSMKRNGLALP